MKKSRKRCYVNINKRNTNILFYTFIRFIKLRQLKELNYLIFLIFKKKIFNAFPIDFSFFFFTHIINIQTFIFIKCSHTYMTRTIICQI